MISANADQGGEGGGVLRRAVNHQTAGVTSMRSG
jgi:hypothetical protein